MAVARAICKCLTCGNEFEIRAVKRNRTEANSFETWAAANITECRECRARAAHEEAMKEAKGLPQLTGSEKQVAWAIDIRARVVRVIKSQYPLQLPDLDAVLKAKVKAGWWIDNRSSGERLLIEETIRKDPELKDRCREIVEGIKQQVRTEIETIAEAGELKNCDATPDEIRAQLEEVRKCYTSVFEAAPADRLIAWYHEHHSKCGIYEMTRDTLRDGVIWDAVARKWVKK